jgi:hypothetical protein
MSDKTSHLLDRPENHLQHDEITIDGVDYEVRQLSKKQTKQMYEEADEAGDAIMRKPRVLMWTVYDPETGERIFGPEHFGILDDLPGDDPEWYEKLWSKVQEVNRFLGPASTSAESG